MNEIVSLGDIINSPEYEKRELEDAMEVVKKYLREDAGLFQEWHKNISKAFSLEFEKQLPMDTDLPYWNIADIGAFNFLDELIKE